MPQCLVGSPVAGQLNGGTGQVALVRLQLVLEAGEQREGVGGGASETRKDLVVIKPPDLTSGRFQHLGPQRDLAIPGQNYLAAAAHAQDCSGANLTI